MNLSNIPSIVEKNIEIANNYLEIYEPLRRHVEISKILNDYRKNPTGEYPTELSNESSSLWKDLKKLSVHRVSHFIDAIKGDRADYILGKKEIDIDLLIQNIQEEISNRLTEFDDNDGEEYLETLKIQKLWNKVKTESDLCEIILNPMEYTTYDYSPLWNINHILVRISINNNLTNDNLEISDISKLLPEVDENKAIEDLRILKEDKMTIERVIEDLIPICKRAMRTDSCWDHNFLNGEIISEIKRRINDV